MKYTTEDCKKYLITIYKDTTESGWKRSKKYKDENQRIARDFIYEDGRTATILETPQGLLDKTLLNKKEEEKKPEKFNPFAEIREKNKTQKTNDNEAFGNFMGKVLGGDKNSYSNPYSSNTNNTTPKSSIEMMREYIKKQEDEEKRQKQMEDFMGMLDNSGMPSIFIDAIKNDNTPIDHMIEQEKNLVVELLKDTLFKDMNSIEEKFLYILVHGTQWEGQDGEKASNDFFPRIKDKDAFINNLVNRNVNIANMYLVHMLNQLTMMEAMDEGYIPFHTMEGDESVLETTKILKEIIDLSEKYGQTINLDKDVVEGVVYCVDALRNLCSMNDAGDLWEIEEIYDVLDDLNNFVKSKSAKKGLKP